MILAEHLHRMIHVAKSKHLTKQDIDAAQRLIDLGLIELTPDQRNALAQVRRVLPEKATVHNVR